MDSRIYPYLQEMFDAARKDGIYPVVREGYRTYEEQQKILDDKIKAYINEGYSQSRAERTAKEWVALPGTSEHQLGIAVDINADKSKSSNDEVYTWLAANAHNYGFCIDKEGVTEEWLNSKAKSARKYSTVFYRGTSDDELDLSGFPKSSRDNIQVALEKQVLIISLGAKLKVGKCKAIRDWFLANEFADFVDEAGSRIRKDEIYEKNYLIGKYGAIPTLKSIDIFKEDWDLKINRIKIIKSIGLKKICWIRFVKSVGLE